MNLYKDGHNLLHIACMYSRKDALLFGLKQGINVNSQNDNVFIILK